MAVGFVTHRESETVERKQNGGPAQPPHKLMKRVSAYTNHDAQFSLYQPDEINEFLERIPRVSKTHISCSQALARIGRLAGKDSRIKARGQQRSSSHQDAPTSREVRLKWLP